MNESEISDTKYNSTYHIISYIISYHLFSFHKSVQDSIYLHISSLVALRDLDGLPVASSLLPYFLIVRLSDVSVVLSLLTAIVAADYKKVFYCLSNVNV